jgi:cyclopropane-fatty-acyl-phospholipid synthase
MSTHPHPTARDAIARSTIHALLGRVRGAGLELTDPWGTLRCGSGEREVAPLRVRVTDPRVYTRVVRHGSVGLGESYADGGWDTDDLTAFLRLVHRNIARTHPARNRVSRAASRVIDPVARLRRSDKERDARHIRAHYDLGDDLFEQLLDPTMMYSCAYFASPDDALETASLAKLDRLTHMLELGPGDRVLEIGTGWGGFAVYAASTYGCSVTTTTTSERQFHFARDRVRAEGLDHLVTVRHDDYRDLRGTFDKVIAIEMIEAVDWREYDAFFAQCRSLLTEAGTLALQAIVVPDDAFDRAKHRTDFIKAAIFPGGCLPSVAALTTAARHAGLAPTDYADIGVHYAETVRRWRSNLAAHGAALDGLGYDARFRRLWEFYFCYCEAGFDERYVSVAQMAFAGASRPPGTRVASSATGSPRPRIS